METVEIEYARPEVAILRLNRPKSLNALSWQLVEDLHAALDALDRDNRCRVVVLTGAGRGFCAGLDLRDQGNPGDVIAGLAPGPRAGLLAQNPRPADSDVDQALGGHICRCGTYQRIRRAVHRAAEEMAAKRAAR